MSTQQARFVWLVRTGLLFFGEQLEHFHNCRSLPPKRKRRGMPLCHSERSEESAISPPQRCCCAASQIQIKCTPSLVALRGCDFLYNVLMQPSTTNPMAK